MSTLDLIGRGETREWDRNDTGDGWVDNHGFNTGRGDYVTRYRPSDFIIRPKESSEVIKGLHCPNCGAQGFRTDKPGIAVCGACSGWYFKYKKKEKKKKVKQRYEMKIINGQLQKVLVTEQKEGQNVS